MGHVAHHLAAVTASERTALLRERLGRLADQPAPAVQNATETLADALVALPLEEYPPAVWRRYCFEQLDLAADIGATPVPLGEHAPALFQLVERLETFLAERDRVPPGKRALVESQLAAAKNVYRAAYQEAITQVEADSR